MGLREDRKAHNKEKRNYKADERIANWKQPVTQKYRDNYDTIFRKGRCK